MIRVGACGAAERFQCSPATAKKWADRYRAGSCGGHGGSFQPTLAATAEAEFLKHKKIGAHGAEIAISPSDIYDLTQLSSRTDRVLPNGVCLLPPLKTCDKGNACLSCGHFATDATHIDELVDQRTGTQSLITTRRFSTAPVPGAN